MCHVTFCSDGNDHVCGCGNKDQASAVETNTVASADAEKSSETEGAEVNADESSGADMYQQRRQQRSAKQASGTAEPFGGDHGNSICKV